jgi:hypothetical protein
MPTVFPWSVFFEVKAANADIGLSYERWQLAGFIDYLSNDSDAAKYRDANGFSGIIPKIVYITTSDVSITPDAIKQATSSGVAVYQVIAEENTAAAAGEDYLRLGGPRLLNPSVYPSSLQTGINVPAAPLHPPTRPGKLPHVLKVPW